MVTCLLTAFWMRSHPRCVAYFGKCLGLVKARQSGSSPPAMVRFTTS